MMEDISNQVFGLRHMALRNALYHIARRRWLDGWSRIFNFIIILGGTGTAAQFTTKNPEIAIWLGGAITFVGAAQLVFDFSGRARAHETLQRRYFALMAEIDRKLDPDEQQCANWRSEFSNAAADEPPTMRALDAIADNQATKALIGGDKPRMAVSYWQHITRHVWAHNNGAFQIDPNFNHSA